MLEVPHLQKVTVLFLPSYTQEKSGNYKTNMTLEKQQFEDVSPIRNGDFPMSCSFSGEYTLVFPMSWLIPNLPFCRPRNCQLEAILPNLPIKSDRDVEAAMLGKVHPVHPQGDKSFRIYISS